MEDTTPLEVGKPFIDYSQYSNWLKCEWQWYERYVRQLVKKRPEAPKADVLTLGSLVHASLEHLRKTGTPGITDEIVTRFGPSAECLAWAHKLMGGYCQTYPNEQFTQYYCEEPLKFDIGSQHIEGLAKIDSYFHIDELTPMQSGLGDMFHLTPGWWIKEYKTKGAGRDKGNYLLNWRVNKQADFQMLALQEKIDEPVQGMLVDVLEKPQEYTPKRTCKGECRGQYELRDWQPQGAEYRCPVCGHVQPLDTSDRSKKERIPAYYRIPVTRSQQQLDASKVHIRKVAMRMLELRQAENPVCDPATDQCVHDFFGECEYFVPHAEGYAAPEGRGFVKIDAIRYVKE